MKGFKPISNNRKITVMIVVGLSLLIGLAAPASAGSWFKAAVGYSGMAMDDINNGDFKFYDYPDDTPGGFDFPPLDGGFSLSFHLGYDLSEEFSLGFSWDKQYARLEGTDQDVTAKLDLDANFFMGHGYWRPLHTGKWDFGGAAGLGFGFPSGNVKVTGENNVNYGQGDTSGKSAFTLEIMALVDYSMSKTSTIEITLGYRSAVIKDIKVDNAPVYNEDGSQLALDYTGYIFKLGYKFIFGE
jgi:hypothetical protein